MESVRERWVRIQLDEVASIIDPQPSHRTPPQYADGIPYIGIGDLTGSGAFDFTNARKVSPKVLLEHKARYTLSEGDFVFGKIGTLGRATRVPALQNYTLSANLILIQPKEQFVDSKYLMYFLQAPETMEEVAKQSNSTSQAAFGIKKMRAFEFSLPALREQTRIAQKLDQLLAQVDTLKARVDAIPAILKRFRQSVLAAAVSGKLTEEWREKHTLKQYSEDKSLGEFRGKSLGELPESWMWLPFSRVAKISSNLKDPLLTPDAVHIAPNHIVSGTGNILNYSTVLEDNVQSPKHGFFSGQILYSKIRPYLNKVALVDFCGLCSADMYPINSRINTEYLYRWMASFQFVDWASNAGSRSVLPKINQKGLNVIPVPTPPIEEQDEIVLRIRSYFEFADLVETKVKCAQKQINHLTQSILAKAFRGELVPLDPNDEPASVLLERIKAARAAEKPKTKIKRKKKTTN